MSVTTVMVRTVIESAAVDEVRASMYLLWSRAVNAFLKESVSVMSCAVLDVREWRNETLCVYASTIFK